jgi:hypothetical protein
MSGLAETTPRPWYRQLWPWLLMVPPVASVLGGAAMVYLATTTSSALVVDDYSRIEELTRDQFARDLRAGELGLNARVAFTAAADGSVSITASLDSSGASLDGSGASYTAAGVRPGSSRAARQASSLLLALRHVTDPKADRALRLERRGDVYVGSVVAAAGRYLVELGPEDRAWRLAGSMPRLAGQIELLPQTGAGP